MDVKFLVVVALLLAGCSGSGPVTQADGLPALQIRCYGEYAGSCEDAARQSCPAGFKTLDVQSVNEPEWPIREWSWKAIMLKSRYYALMTFRCA